MRSCFLFGITQFVLSVAVWGGLEFSMLVGDSVQPSSLQFLPFIASEKLIPYAILSIINSFILWAVTAKFTLYFHPGSIGALVLAAGTVFLTVLLSLNTMFNVRPPYVVIVAFMVVLVFYWVVFVALRSVRGK